MKLSDEDTERLLRRGKTWAIDADTVQFLIDLCSQLKEERDRYKQLYMAMKVWAKQALGEGDADR